MKIIIKENENNIMFHHFGTTKFNGCQCFSDCSCFEDFKQEDYNFFTVCRKNKKTTKHETLEEANKRWDFVCNL